MIRNAALWFVVSLGLTGWIYLEGDTSMRQLPIVFGCCLALGGLIYLGGRYQAARPKSSAVKVSVVADNGGMLVIERRGGAPCVRRLSDGSVLAEAAVGDVPSGPSHDLELRGDTVVFGDVARLW